MYTIIFQLQRKILLNTQHFYNKPNSSITMLYYVNYKLFPIRESCMWLIKI